MLDEIHAAGGQVFAITSEPQALATEAEDDWGFGFPAVGDPHHEILETLRERDLLRVYANEDYGHLRHRSWASHPKGYYQPATIALAGDGRVLYRWRCVPQWKNMSGAGGRPAPRYAWGQIELRLAEKGGADAPLDEHAELAGSQISWPYFLLILFAHGWFLRAKAFPLGRPGDPPSANSGKMMGRVAGFVAAWVAGFLLFPAKWVALAMGAWALAALPGLIEIHRQFQNEPEPHGEPGAVQPTP